MANLPVLKPQEVVARLERLGFVEIRQRGSYKQLRHPDGRGNNGAVSQRAGHLAGAVAKDRPRHWDDGGRFRASAVTCSATSLVDAMNPEVVQLCDFLRRLLCHPAEPCDERVHIVYRRAS